MRLLAPRLKEGVALFNLIPWGEAVSETRTIEISIKQLISGAVVLALIVLVIVAVATRDTWTQLFQGDVARSETEVTETKTVIYIPQAGGNAASVATLSEGVARAYYTIDYRDQAGWVKQFEPYATATTLELIQTVFAPISFALFEKDELVIEAEQVTVEDRGIMKQGDEWQIRLVDVHIDDLPESMLSSDLEMRLLLVTEDGTWKYQAILTEEDVASFSEGG